MSPPQTSSTSKASIWQNPLLILTLINYLNYIDRYILAAVLAPIQKDFSLTDFQAGLLATAFIIPYMLTSPFFGWLGDTKPRAKLLALGATLWSFSSLLTGMASSFITLVLSRFLLGIGESAFTVISIPFLSDSYSEDTRGRKLSIFATALPVGAALGFVLGGFIANIYGWRAAFLGAGFPGFLFAALAWKLKEPPRSTDGHPTVSIIKDTLNLFKSSAYTYSVFGYCAYSFVVGGVAHWVPTYMQRSFAMNAGQASTLFGGIAVVTGLTGTLVGGWLGDRRRGAHLYLSAWSMLISLPAFVLCIATDSVQLFLASLVVTQLMFFISTSPINVALLESSPKHLGTSAIAIAVFACHILGDAISAPLIGVVSDGSQSLRNGMMMCAPFIGLCTILWLKGAQESKKSQTESLA
jgi:predicted MFS family arabinose efflux permease